MEHFGFDDESSHLVFNGEKDWRKEEPWEEEESPGEEATVFRGVAARELPVKQMSRDMAKPTVGSCRRMKKIARYLVNRKRIIWHFE